MANRDFNKIKRTIQDFSLNAGEGGNGSVIVDTLPTNGKEGQTYLLRKTEGTLVSFKLYEAIGEGGILCVYKNDETKEVITSLEGKYFNSFLEIYETGSITSFIANFASEETFNEYIKQGHVVVINSLEELPKEGPQERAFVHLLGEFTNNDIKLIHMNISDYSEEYYESELWFFIELDGLVESYTINSNTFISKTRAVNFDSDAGEWMIGEWEVWDPTVEIIDTLTDEIITDSNLFYDTFEYAQGALTTFTPQPIYKYTQYVYDKGQYNKLGGLILVSELPEIGDENSLYKLPDGTIWSCTNKTETKTISDLEVGKSYKLAESILAEDFLTLGAKVTLDDSVRFECSSTSYIEIYKDNKELDVDYCLGSDLEDPSWVSYIYNYAEPVENVEASLEFFEELPDVEINQTFVDSIAETSYKLEDLIPLFQNSSHTEEVTISKWSQIGGANITNITVITKFEDGIFELDKTNEELIELFNNNTGPIYIRNPKYNNCYGAMIYSCGTYPDNPDSYFFSVISFNDPYEGGGIRYYYEDNQWKYEGLE